MPVAGQSVTIIGASISSTLTPPANGDAPRGAFAGFGRFEVLQPEASHDESGDVKPGLAAFATWATGATERDPWRARIE
jgi:hypothetical protein